MMNIKKTALFLIVVFMTISCTKRTQPSNDNSEKTEADFYTVSEIYPWLYSINDTDNSVSCYLLIGDERAVLFDTTYGYGSLDSVVRQITELPITVILGHGHTDHAGGAPQFYSQSDIWLNEADFNLYRYSNHEQEMELLKKLNIGQVFELGGLTLEVVGMEGHTAGSIGLLVKEHRVLLTSDSANPTVWLFLNESLPVESYIKMLERTILLDFDTFFIGHSDEPMPKSEFEYFINAARNATVEYSEPFHYQSVFVYEEDGASILFRGDLDVWQEMMSAEIDLPVGNLGFFELKLKDNFLYGNGYQGLIRNKNLLDGHRLKKGEVYTLKVTYTVDRDLENDLLVGFVDMEGAKWKTLSYAQKAIEPPNVILGRASKAGEEVSSEVTITIEKSARISSAAANTLVIETIGEGKHLKRNSGVKGPVTISFTEFVLQKVK